MDLKVFTATLSAIFFAEIADKTQLVSLTMAGKTAKPWAVLLGAVAGFSSSQSFPSLPEPCLGSTCIPNTFAMWELVVVTEF